MQDFIVLGMVPGTQIQLTFMFWIYIGIGFFSVLLLVSQLRRHSLTRYVAARRIAHTIAQYDLITI